MKLFSFCLSEVARVPSPEKGSVGSINRGQFWNTVIRSSLISIMLILTVKEISYVGFADAVLAKVETEKRNSLIKAWEENQKSKAENK